MTWTPGRRRAASTSTGVGVVSARALRSSRGRAACRPARSARTPSRISSSTLTNYPVPSWLDPAMRGGARSGTFPPRDVADTVSHGVAGHRIDLAGPGRPRPRPTRGRSDVAGAGSTCGGDGEHDPDDVQDQEQAHDDGPDQADDAEDAGGSGGLFGTGDVTVGPPGVDLEREDQADDPEDGHASEDADDVVGEVGRRLRPARSIGLLVRGPLLLGAVSADLGRGRRVSVSGLRVVLRVFGRLVQEFPLSHLM